MSYHRSAKQRVSRKERRETGRETAKLEREHRRRREQQRAVWLRAGAAFIALVVVAGVGFAVRARILDGQRGPANMASDGILFTGDGKSLAAASSAPLARDGAPTPSADHRASGVVDIVAFVDYGDPASAAFWAANGGAVRSWALASSGAVTLELRPVALDEGRGAYTATPSTSSAAPTPTLTPNALDAGGDYARRAANAVACVASYAAGKALDVNDALFTAQSTFGDRGLTDTELVTLVKGVGVDDERVASCITSHRYADWVLAASARAVLSVPFDGVDGLRSTPLVIVGGQQYTGDVSDATTFQAFVMERYSSIYAAASATAAPTPDATPAATDAPAVGSSEQAGQGSTKP